MGAHALCACDLMRLAAPYLPTSKFNSDLKPHVFLKILGEVLNPVMFAFSLSSLQPGLTHIVFFFKLRNFLNRLVDDRSKFNSSAGSPFVLRYGPHREKHGWAYQIFEQSGQEIEDTKDGTAAITKYVT